ncbi:hypothetical protein [Arthrobacter sp. A2-55]|uniref:hypothetical protein n=1 Tax=Arthrobacter sp. A2-55 TaxID=2897337 RepID=UPI0021CD1BB4|nr:hypothetical protein [Arthrobacter sp. A2-55]MCU6480182.1 hypothetical protein [Arthrobacter sp. A2-55]
MATMSINEAFNATTQMDVREIVQRLNSRLGATIVAALTGSKDRKLPHRWAKLDGPVPSDDFQRRLILAYRAWLSVAGAEGDSVGRMWFIGANPFLGEDTPMTAIREDRAADVMGAVAALIDDRQDV